ncbi:peptidoglycan-binding protein [uncultured Methanobrevibacter sp.]|uniref:peptidoglycan-binding protein n=1 Tax=uncultured Methanobrevibacter sp. TaxID=253161 RepID=UPI0025E66AD4|nr:peptidoglycan-binding protein [uncultured Methanobrevibacter sp.]
MKYKKTIILLALVVFLLSIAGVSASEIDNTIASENANTIELSADNDIEDNLQTSEENGALASTDYDEAIAQTDTEVLGADSAKYSDLANEIRQPGNIKLTHKNYTYTGGETITIGEANKVIDGNGAVIDMAGSTIRAFNISASGVTIKNLTIKNANYKGNGGAIYFNSTGTVTNCNFTGNTANYGALYFLNQGTVTNCNFTGNTANFDGGVIKMGSGTVSNCNFVDNKANEDGGAVYFKSNGEVTNCNFTGNTATRFGGAVYFLDTGTVSNCNFTDNSATLRGGAIFSRKWSTTADTCIFKRNSGDNVNTVIYPPTLNVNNFTTVYGSGEKLTFDLKTNSSIPVTNGNISISVYFKDNNSWVGNYSCLSGEGWIPDLPVGSYIAVFNTEYAEFQKINRTIRIIPNIKFYANVTSAETNNRTVNITAKSNIPQDILEGKLLFILPNGTQIEATYGANGIWWAEHTFDAYGEYKVNATYVGLDNVAINNGTITINKVNSTITLDDIVLDYGETKNVTVTTTGATGITAKIGESEANVDGFVISIPLLDAGNYTLTVTTIPDDDHNPVTKDIKVTVKKATPKLTAKKKTFKTTPKTKKYTIVLKDNTGKAIKKAKVTLKVKGKTYKATTNSKGKATFKITKLNKKGTFKATVTYKGNKYFNKVSKKAKIKVIVTFKTVSKGSKDKATVKEIQQALKDKGYYLTYQGHYLKVDGKFSSCTFRSVKEFQHDKGLKVTGKVDEKTAKKLGLI